MKRANRSLLTNSLCANKRKRILKRQNMPCVSMTTPLGICSTLGCSTLWVMRSIPAIWYFRSCHLCYLTHVRESSYRSNVSRNSWCGEYRVVELMTRTPSRRILRIWSMKSKVIFKESRVHPSRLLNMEKRWCLFTSPLDSSWESTLVRRKSYRLMSWFKASNPSS